MLENSKKTIGMNCTRSKSKTKYISSKPTFLIPFNASRFLNLPPRKSQTPTRPSKSPSRPNRASSQSHSDNKAALQPQLQQKSPIQSKMSKGCNLGRVKEQKSSALFNTNARPSVNSSTTSDKSSNDIFSILHFKDQGANVLQSDRLSSPIDYSATYYTNNTTNRLALPKETGSAKIQVHMKINESFKSIDNATGQSPSPLDERRSPVSVTRSTSVNISKCTNSNNTSLIKKDCDESELKCDRALLANVKSASEAKLKGIGASSKADEKPMPHLSYKSKPVFNTVNANGRTNAMSKANSHANSNNTSKEVAKKQFRDLNTSPLLRTKGKEKAKSPFTASSKPKRQRTPTNSQNKKKSAEGGFSSPEPRATNGNSPVSIITNGIDTNVNSIISENGPMSNIKPSISVHIKRSNPSIVFNTNRLMKNQLGGKSIIQIDSITKKGFDGQGMKKVNQDNLFVYKNLNRENACMFIGVCDGHGMFGHDVSGYLIAHLPSALNAALISKHLPLSNQFNLNALLIDAFNRTNANLISDTSIDTSFSGSTCVSMVYTPDKITCANVGDSRAIIGRCMNGTWSSKNISRDHKPNDTEEHNRIIQAGGRIEAYKDDEGNYIGPERVWVKEEDIPGLAMSRSFGDEKAQSVGVIATPEIMEFPLEPCDKFIVLASDGIWEFIESEECVHMIKDFYLQNDAPAALSFLYKESAKRWIQQEEVIDDITAVIIFFE